MITIQLENQTIKLSGDTYTVRHTIRAMGGTFDKVSKGWNVPYSAEAYAKCEALAAGQPATDAPAQAPAQAPVPSDAPDLTAALAAFVSQHNKAAVDPAQVAAIAAKVCQDLLADFEAPSRGITLTLKPYDREAFTLEGLAHEALPVLIQSLTAGLHVWLAGPSGSGKTHGAAMAAQALGLTFRLQGAMTMAHELTGFVDAGGKYHETPFVTSFRSGGLILLDELDAGSNEALLALNAALANGLMCLPSGEIIRAHADFKCIGAANTFGAGATAEYVGRTRIDAAFLQRFGARISWGYDEALEVAMSGNPTWAKRVQAARKKAAAVGLKVLITPRASQAGARLIAAGMTAEQAAELTYLADLSPAQRQQIGG